MSKWLQGKADDRVRGHLPGQDQDAAGLVKGRVPARPCPGPGQAHQLPRRGEHRLGLAWNQRFADISPEYPTFSVLVTEGPTGSSWWAMRCALAGGTDQGCRSHPRRLELLDGDRIEPGQLPLRARVLNRLKAKGPRPGAQPQRTAVRHFGRQYFAPIKYRLEPDLLVTVLGGLVYSGDIVLSITGDKIDSGKLVQLAERSLEELKQFKHVEAPKEINLAVLRALFELFDLPSGLAQKASQGDTEPVIKLQEKVSALVPACSRLAPTCSKASSALGPEPAARKKPKDWHARLDSLKSSPSRWRRTTPSAS